MIGTRIAHYEITSHLGSGGMGEVYQATDSKLGRRVAIKFLPAAFASDPERLSRFRREAQVLASLNHSNIAQIYGLEESGESRCIVMEWIDGETLHERIQRGSIPLDEALHIAKQIAEALEVAHEKGIVHRDLKPGNVMLTADGKVKVLDFGLAKATEFSGSDVLSSNSPTMTHPGLILGTAAYMSPEQARGKNVDRRADIWAFGAVLYEMLTGQRAFSGEDLTDTLATVVKIDPNWETLGTDVPDRVRQVLRMCLQKDPKQRVQAIGDVRLALEGAFEMRSEVSLVQQPRASRTSWFAVAGGAVVGALIAVTMLWSWLGKEPVTATTRVSVITPETRPVVVNGFPTRSLAISPDGTTIAYVGAILDSPGQRGARLQLRLLNTREVHDLPGTVAARQPFFSPDGQWVGFFSQTELKKISIAGGNPVTLAENINGAGSAFGVWSDDDTIIFGTLTTGLRRVSAEGGEVTTLTTPDAAQGEVYHLFPTLVPSNAAVLFGVRYRDPSKNRIDAVMLDSLERRVVIENGRVPLVTHGGYVLFQRENSILVAPFDSKRLAISGPVVPLIDEVRDDASTSPIPVAELAASRNGTLAYLPAIDSTKTLGIADKSGAFTPLAVPAGNISHPRVSPDRQSVAFVVSQGQTSDVYVHDLIRGSTTKLTQEGRDEGPEWRDNHSLSVFSRRKDVSGIFLKGLDGQEQFIVPLPATATNVRNASWSPDGTKLAYTLQVGLLHDIWVATMGPKPTSVPIVNDPASEHSPKFSPDGQWLAYTSNESGRVEVYVRKFPEGERLSVSTSGGNGPMWAPDGRQLFFSGSEENNQKMMTVSVTPGGGSLRLGKPISLFGLRKTGPTGEIQVFAAGSNLGSGYDILSDSRFVMVQGVSSGAAREIVLVQNWFEELRRLTAK